MNRRLYRSVADRRIGGVAAGTATYFDVDPSIARVLWLLLAFFTGGVFVIVYLVMWAVVPEEPWAPAMASGQPRAPAAPAAPATGEGGEAATGEGGAAASTEGTSTEGAGSTGSVVPASWPPQPARASSGPGGHVILGAILILIGAWFLAQEFLPWLNWDLVWPVGLVVIGVLILAAALRRGS